MTVVLEICGKVIHKQARETEELSLLSFEEEGLPSATVNILNQIEEQVNKDKVVLYTKSWCRFSAMTRETLTKLGVNYTDYLLDKLDNGDTLQAGLAILTKQVTVPNIFIGGQHIGGND